MNSTERFIALLEERELVSSRTAESLREQVAESRKPVSPESLAKRLIKHGRLTSTQAKRLLDALKEEGAAAEKPTKTERKQKTESQPKVAAKPAESGSLDFAPLDDEPGKKKPAAKPAEKPAEKPKAEQSVERKPVAPSGPPAAAPDSLLDQEMPAAPTAAVGGPLDGLMSEAAMVAGDSTGPLDSSSSRRRGLFRFFRRDKPKVKTGEEQWGSSLMLLGGGGLLLLIIVGGALWYSLSRNSGDEMLQQADDDYRGGSYSQAIAKYDKFLEQFPNHERASVARVRIGLAQLRQKTDSKRWEEAHKEAQDVLNRIAPEKDFKEAHQELASMLPTIAEGLAAEAHNKTSRELIDKSREATAMTNKYVPKSLVPLVRLEEVERRLQLTEKAVAQDDELAKTVALMQAAAKEARTQDAYAACSALLRVYPKLVSDEKLTEALLQVSQAQQKLVETVAERKPAAADQPADAASANIALARSTVKSNAPDADGHIALAEFDGSVYGLNAADGKLLWRRFVGLQTNPRGPSFPPTFFSPEPGSDALVVDAARNELLRLEAATGNIRWRHNVGERFDAHPVVAGGKILVAARSGKLVAIDAAGGDSPHYIKFPQELTVAPAVDARRSLVYQVAVHSNLFVISLEDGACREVFYLGHGQGSVTTAPVVIDDFLLVVVNDGANDSVLKLFVVQDKKTAPPEPSLNLVQEIRLGGHVKTPPLIDGRRVLVSTAAGVVRVYEISATNVKIPLRKIADTAIEGGANLIRFPLLRRGRFWIADNRLTKYDIQAARGRLMPQWIADQEGAFLQQPAVVGEAVICVQRNSGMPGAVVSAVSVHDPQQYWNTQIGCAPASAPVVMDQNGKAVVVTSAGTVFRIDAGGQGARVVNEPIAAADAWRVNKPINNVVPLPNGLLAMNGGKGSNLIGVFDPKDENPLLYLLTRKDELACPPVAMGGGLLVADRAGQVSLIDPKTGDDLAKPFMPRLEPGEKIDWMPPAAADENSAVLADGRGKVYLLGIKDQPEPHIALLGQTTVANPVVSAMAVFGATAFGADSANMLGGFAIPKLERSKEVNLETRCNWGPVRIGDVVFVTTDDDRLLCIDAEGNVTWRVELKHGPLAGAPLRHGESFIIVARGGAIQRLDAANGNELGALEAGCPLATGASLLGDALLVGGYDGTIYKLRQP